MVAVPASTPDCSHGGAQAMATRAVVGALFITMRPASFTRNGTSGVARGGTRGLIQCHVSDRLMNC